MATDFFSQFKPKSESSDFFSQFSKRDDEEEKPDFFSQFSDVVGGSSVKVDKPSVWDDLSPMQKWTTAAITPITSSGLLGENVRDYASALVQRGADSTAGAVFGLGELAHDYLEKNPNLKLALNVATPSSMLLDQFDSGHIAGTDKKFYAREEMQNQVNRRMGQAIDQIAGTEEEAKYDPLAFLARKHLKMVDTGVAIVAPMVVGALTGGGLSTGVASGLVKAGMASVPKGLAGKGAKEAMKFLARQLTTPNILGGAAEGALQGAGDSPSDVLSGSTLGAGVGAAGAFGGALLGKLFNNKSGQKALESMRSWFDPESVKVKEVLAGDTLLPPGATGEVINVPEFDPKAIDFTSGLDPTFVPSKLPSGIDFNSGLDPTAIPTKLTSGIDFTSGLNKDAIPGFDSGPFKVVTRVDSEEGSLNLTNKPQGTYVSTSDNGVYEGYGFGNVKSKTTISPKNPLVIDNNEDISAGTALLKNFFGDEEADRIMRLNSDDIESEILSKYPGVDLSNVRQKWDLFDIYGAQEAKLRGHDYVEVNNKHAPDHSEGVILDDSIVHGWERVHPNPGPVSPIKLNLDDPASVAQAKATASVTGLSNLGQMGSAISANLRTGLWEGYSTGKGTFRSDPFVMKAKKVSNSLTEQEFYDLIDTTYSSKPPVAQVPPSGQVPPVPPTTPPIDVSFDPKGPTSQRTAAEVPGTIAMMDELDRMHADLTKDIPNEPWSKVKKKVGEHIDKTAKTRNLGPLERAAHKIWGQLTSRGSVGGLRKNVSFTAAKAEFIEADGKAFSQFMNDELLAQPRVTKEIIQNGMNKITDIEQAMMPVAQELGIGFTDLNRLIHKAVTTKNYDLIPESLRPQVKAYGTWMWDELGQTLIRNGVKEDIAKGMIYRNIDYLHQRYIGQNVDPDIWMANRAIQDPESFKKTMSWYKQKIMEEMGDDLPKLQDGSVDMEALNMLAANRVRGVLTEGRTKETAPVLEKGAAGSIDFDILKTTQGKIETGWTDYLNAGAAKIKADAAEALDAGPALFVRPEVDSMFDSYLENIPRASANRIRNNYVADILKRKGIDLPPGEKIDYLSVRKLVDETEKEFLFRQAIRQEDMPDFVAKFMGGHDSYTDAARDTLVKLAHDVSMVKMYHGLTSEGLKSGAFSPVPTNNWEAITGASKLGLGSGYDALYAPPMTARIFNQSVEAADNLHWLYRFNNNLKAGKILSLPGVMRNGISANWQGFFLGDVSPFNFRLYSDANAGHNAAVKSIFSGSGGLGSGVLRNEGSRKAIYRIFGTEFMEDPKFLAEFQDLIHRGIIGGGSEREIEEIARVMSLQSAQVGDAAGMLTQDAVSLISRIYQAPDVFVKTLAMRNRTRQFHWAEGGKWSEGVEKASEATRDMAAKAVTAEYQSYELTAPLAKSLSRLPGGPAFITFAVESLRNFKNTGVELAKYIGYMDKAVKAGDPAKAGRWLVLTGNKLGHIALATYGVYTAAAAINEQFGITDKVKSAASDLINWPGNKGAPFIVTDYDPTTHKMKFIDLANANPYPHIASMVRLMDDTGKNWDQKLDELTSELGAIYAPTPMLPKIIIEGATGRSVRSVVDFGSSYRYDRNPNAPGATILDDSPTVREKEQGRRIYRFYRSLAPAVANQGEAGIRGITGDPIGSRSFSVLGEMGFQATGLRENDVDFKTAYEFALRETKDKVEALRSDWVSTARSIPESDTKALAELRKTKQGELDVLYNDAIYFASVARTLHFSDREIDSMLEKMDSRIFIKKFRSSIISGQPMRIQDLWNYEKD